MALGFTLSRSLLLERRKCRNELVERYAALLKADLVYLVQSIATEIRIALAAISRVAAPRMEDSLTYRTP